jgi:hypothetical protein
MEAPTSVIFLIYYRNQFHDVLPGSSIEIAYEDPVKVSFCSLYKFHREILTQGGKLVQKGWKHLYESFQNVNSDKQGKQVV